LLEVFEGGSPGASLEATFEEGGVFVLADEVVEFVHDFDWLMFDSVVSFHVARVVDFDLCESQSGAEAFAEEGDVTASVFRFSRHDANDAESVAFEFGNALE